MSNIEYVCNACGAQYSKHQGKCDRCHKWNSIEEKISEDKKSKSLKYDEKNINDVSAVLVQDIINSNQKVERLHIDKEFDRVLGDGIVKGSLILLGGEPGIGKSTLSLQIALRNPHTLYISGEEKEFQIGIRAKRLSQYFTNNSDCHLLSISDATIIKPLLDKYKPTLVIIDSIQTLEIPELDSPIGSINQIKEITNLILKYAKTYNIAFIIIGHINKEGDLAGPKILEHMVDVVLYFECDENKNYRILRSIKNRYGITPELGIYNMNENGLVPVDDPSSCLISHYKNLSGITTTAISKGRKTFMIEVQALIGNNSFHSPQRICTGIDIRRMNLLIAVIEKKLGLKLYNKDIFVNIVGGINIQSTSLDLAICTAIYSSYYDIIIPNNHCFIAEVGLCGELRMVHDILNGINIANQCGYNTIYIPNMKNDEIKKLNRKNNIDIKTMNNIKELRTIFVS